MQFVRSRTLSSINGEPFLLMELAFLLRGVGSEVCWITNQKPPGTDQVIYSLENKMLDRVVQVFSAKSQEAIKTALKADMVILNIAVTGKWLDDVPKENVPHVLLKVLWWIHETRDYYFSMDYVKHLPSVVGDMIGLPVTAEYWKNRTRAFEVVLAASIISKSGKGVLSLIVGPRKVMMNYLPLLGKKAPYRK